MNSTAFIAFGGNLVPDGFSTLEEVMTAAIADIATLPIEICATSSLYETAPVPISDQPWFLNGVLHIKTDLSAADLLAALHQIEHDFGRVRSVRNEARILDLDLIDYQGVLSDEEGLQLPHPRMHERAFVLLPLRDVMPDWQHPRLHKSISHLIDEMPAGQQIRQKT